MKPKQFYFTMLGMTVVLALLIGVGYYYASQRLRDRTAVLKSKMVDIDVANDQVDTLQQLQRDYDKLSPSIPKINAALPQTKEQSELLLQLQQLAASNGLKIQTISFSGTTAGATPSSVSQTVKSGDALVMPVSFQLSGGFGQLQGFLQGLERFDRYTNVTTITIARDKAPALTYTVGLNAYLKP
jgi:Tfp pilus assembly protein PilO